MNVERFGLGVIVGKFLPPHRGHRFLIETALSRCDRVVVIVGGALPVHTSVSIGVAVRDASTPDPEALIRLADQSAYLAKRDRNAVATMQTEHLSRPPA